MIQRFTARNYKNVDAQDLELGRINLLIGPNNAGKSNFIRALGFLPDLLNAPGGHFISFMHAALEHGGKGILSRKAGSKGAVNLGWGIGTHIRYQLGFEVDTTTDHSRPVRIFREELAEVRGGRRRSWVAAINSPPTSFTVESNFGEILGDVDAHETIFRRTLRLQEPREAAEEFAAWWDGARRELGRWSAAVASYSTAEFNPREIASPHEAEFGQARIGRDAKQLANVVKHFDQEHDEWRAGLAEWMAELAPGVQAVRAYDGGTYRWVQLKIGGRWRDLAEMSDGTVQALVLAVLLTSPEPLEVLCIDEPELNLHPAWLKVLGRWFQRSTGAKQLFLSTHSPDLLDTFTEGFRSGDVKVLVFEPDKGDGPRVRTPKPAELDGFFQEGWELGDLYRVAEPTLGGWPW